uniref:Uncharacterized protein n=1 Tax=Megaselia scalaris TaxID=36166 RepID=T1H2J7_MEGSC
MWLKILFVFYILEVISGSQKLDTSDGKTKNSIHQENGQNGGGVWVPGPTPGTWIFWPHGHNFTGIPENNNTNAGNINPEQNPSPKPNVVTEIPGSNDPNNDKLKRESEWEKIKIKKAELEKRQTQRCNSIQELEDLEIKIKTRWEEREIENETKTKCRARKRALLEKKLRKKCGIHFIKE